MDNVELSMNKRFPLSSSAKGYMIFWVGLGYILRYLLSNSLVSISTFGFGLGVGLSLEIFFFSAMLEDDTSRSS